MHLSRGILRQQEGTGEKDNIQASTVREDGVVLFAGRTTGSWDVANSDSDSDFAAVFLNTGMAATSPYPVPLLAPSTPSSGSNAGRNTIITGAVVGVVMLLAIIGVCICRRQKATGTVCSPATAKD